MSWEAVLLCSLLLSCAGTNEEAAASASAEGAQFTALLTAVNQTPDDTLQLCAGLTDAELYGECIVAGVEALPAAATSQAQEFCTAIDAQQAAVPRSECFFRVAERSLRPELCEQSQLFEEDCRMHLWTRSLRSSLPKQAAPGEVETDVSRQAAEFGFEVSDTRPWVALYRVLLGRMKPMKRSTCDAVSDTERAAICRATGLDLFHDRLNHIRDRGLFPCEGGPLPEVLNAHLDPGLEEALSERREQDLCP